MADPKKPLGVRLVRTELSALTRQHWTGLVVVDTTIRKDDLGDLTKMVYDHVDGGDYEDDPAYWERGESCHSQFVTTPDRRPTLVAYKDDEDSLVLTDLPQGESPAAFLRKLRAAGGDAQRIGRVEKARELFQTIDDLDGCGIAGTDDDLLAEAIARKFDVRPSEVSDHYTGEEDEEDDTDEEDEFAWPGSAYYADWPRFDVTLKGFYRVHNAFPDEEFPNRVLKGYDDLVKWVIAPSHAVVSKWVADAGLTPFVDSVDEMENRADIQGPADGLDLVLDAEGHVIGGNPEVAAAWKKQAQEFGDWMAEGNIVPIYTNHYSCGECDESWEDTWPGQPDDECPKCKQAYTPYKSDEVHGFVESKQ